VREAAFRIQSHVTSHPRAVRIDRTRRPRSTRRCVIGSGLRTSAGAEHIAHTVTSARAPKERSRSSPESHLGANAIGTLETPSRTLRRLPHQALGRQVEVKPGKPRRTRLRSARGGCFVSGKVVRGDSSQARNDGGGGGVAGIGRGQGSGTLMKWASGLPRRVVVRGRGSTRDVPDVPLLIALSSTISVTVRRHRGMRTRSEISSRAIARVLGTETPGLIASLLRIASSRADLRDAPSSPTA
jgi:hypothetical protein